MKIDILTKDHVLQSMERLPPWLRRGPPCADQIKSLRTTLGMTQAQLGQRATQDGRSIRRLESGRANPSLATLEKIADGLECELIVRFVPKRPLAEIIRERATTKARQLVSLVKGSSAMEEQEPGKAVIENEVQRLTNEFLEQTPSSLWDEDL